jgi:hypothetical protein
MSARESFIFSFTFVEEGMGLCETFGMTTHEMAKHLADVEMRCRAQAVGVKADVPAVLVQMVRKGEIPAAVLLVLASVAMTEILEETPREIDMQRRKGNG